MVRERTIWLQAMVTQSGGYIYTDFQHTSSTSHLHSSFFSLDTFSHPTTSMPKAAMSTTAITIKHAGKAYPLEVNLAGPALDFKNAIYQVTGVPVDRMKVMVKGGMLKDDADLTKLAIKPNAAIMVIGNAGPLPEAPKQAITFLEDMDDSELALATKAPTGLVNLGNTCYANASVQALRAIPELRTALTEYKPRPNGAFGTGDNGLTNAMKNLWNSMERTTEGVPPLVFLQALRTLAPQFAEQSRHGGYAQQDADECWTTMTNALQALPGVNSSSGNFISQYMMGEMQQVLTCDEAPEEPSTTLTERIPKLDCNISITTNYMHTGIMDSLDQKIEKASPSLGRSAVYTQKSRLSRLPGVLTVHLVRFYWRRDTNSKAKIMRKVKFPFEFDALDMCTDELKAKILPVNTALKTVIKNREERARIRKRVKAQSASAAAEAAIASTSTSTTSDVAMTPNEPTGSKKEGEEQVYLGTAEEEDVKRAEEKALLSSLIDGGLKEDIGANQSGMYELCAIVTHKGASADSGHYMAFVKKQAEPASVGSSLVNTAAQVSTDEEWFKFDDDKVSSVTREKVSSLDGGGEDSSAYILVYRSAALE